MNSKRICIVASGCAAMVAGCSTQPTQEQSGMVVGGVVGVVGGVPGPPVGHGHGRTATSIIGAVLGGALGGNVGRSMDDRDRTHTALALDHVRTGVPSQWGNPDTGTAYTVVPRRTYDTAQGPCREYTVDADVGGRTERMYMRACREADGSWHAAR